MLIRANKYPVICSDLKHQFRVHDRNCYTEYGLSDLLHKTHKYTIGLKGFHITDNSIQIYLIIYNDKIMSYLLIFIFFVKNLLFCNLSFVIQWLVDLLNIERAKFGRINGETIIYGWSSSDAKVTSTVSTYLLWLNDRCKTVWRIWNMIHSWRLGFGIRFSVFSSWTDIS